MFTTLGTFGLIMLLSRKGFEGEEIDDLAGLSQRSPMVAGVMTVFMFSLAGVPPTVGFFAKLSVIQALVSTNVTLYIVLAVVAVLFSLIGAFYYLRVVKVMWSMPRCRPLPSIVRKAWPRCWPPTGWRCWCWVCSPAG